jgi:3-deoxy-manno-octulosonate cytidylyltransferase (CMP-KDO synthetase)
MAQTAIIIPARYGSTRLSAKALRAIGSATLIEQVWRRAKQVPNTDVFVATDHDDIAATVHGFGGRVIMTPASCETGSDRVAAALDDLPADVENIINVQGDLPFIDPSEILGALSPLRHGFDVGTLVACMPEEKQLNPSFVKSVLSVTEHPGIMRCHWFCRAALPYGHHHLGVYAYTREALAAFASNPPHPLESQEQLEQLRFLTLGYRVGAVLVNSLAIEVNTEEDLIDARRHAEASEASYAA